MLKTTAHAEERDETSRLVASNLRDYMDAERWTGRKFAFALGLQPVYVQRRMSGEVEMSASDLKLFGDQLGVKVQDFYSPRSEGPNRRKLVPMVAGSTPVGGTILRFPTRERTHPVEGTRLAPVTPIRVRAS